jgi:hypothetical protein
LCANQADQNGWLTALRKSAGCDNPDGGFAGKIPSDRQGSLCSYGVLLMNAETKQPDRVVCLFNIDNTVQILKDDQVAETIPARNIITVVHAISPDLSLMHTDGVTQLYSVSMEQKNRQKQRACQRYQKVVLWYSS